MKNKDAQEALAEPSRGACEEEKQEQAYEEGRLARESMKNPSCSNGEWIPTIQAAKWITTISRPVASDESSVLYRKTVRVQANRAKVAQPNTSSLASKGTLKAKIAKREHLWSEEKRNQPAKLLKGGPFDVKQGTKESSLGGEKIGYSSHHKQDQLLQQSKTCTLADPNLAALDRCVTPLPGGNDASLSKNDLVWPRFVIALSRKEKEEDFLILKGTKLPQWPKRSSKSSPLLQSRKLTY